MSSPSPFVVLSDLDDTIKVSHTVNRIRTVIRGLFTSQVYAGMPELFQEWSKQGAEIQVMSSSPIWIRARIERFFSKHRFPPVRLTLRDWLKEKDIRGYKQEKLQVLAASLRGPVVLIGDDSEWDPEVFHEFKEANPGRVLAIYIRRVRNRPLHREIIPFSTAFEIALSEYHSGRLKAAQVSRVGKALLDQRDPDLIIPYFVSAPEGLLVPLEAPFESLQAQIHDRLLRIHDDHRGGDSE